LSQDIELIRENWLYHPSVAALKTHPGGAESGVRRTCRNHYQVFRIAPPRLVELRSTFNF
jgi:hypothetical protein